MKNTVLSGKSVRDALIAQTANWAVFDEVIAAVEAVHRDGVLMKTPIRREDTGGRQGCYQYNRETNQPMRIDISPYAMYPYLAIAHEIGHFLDHQALEAPGVFASAQSPLMEAWRQSVTASANFTRFTMLRSNRYIVIDRANGPNNVEIKQDEVGYLMQWPEFFARSYAQYITTRSGNPVMMAELGIYLNDNPIYTGQWEAEDFLPIRNAMDNAFRRKGWLP